MSREDGFTLVELLVAMVIGLIVMLAGVQALDSFTARSATVTTRTDNTQRARLYMDLVVRELRSQVCQGPGAPSMLAASPTEVSFVADLSDGSTPAKQHTVTYDASRRRLSSLRLPGKRDPAGTLIFEGTPSAGPGLSTVSPVDAATPIFRFYAYDTASPPRPDALLAGTLTTADLRRVARITVAYRVGPAAAVGNASSSAVLENDVFLRSVDPSDPAPLPRCT